MKPQNASALAAAGMLSALVFPMLGPRRLRANTGATADGAPVQKEP